MTIYYGSQGTICFYYKGLLISSFPLTKVKSEAFYLELGERLIRSSKGIPITERIKYSLTFMNNIHSRKINNLSIYKSDHQLFITSLMAMMRLNIIDNDDENGFMVFKYKKK